MDIVAILSKPRPARLKVAGTSHRTTTANKLYALKGAPGTGLFNCEWRDAVPNYNCYPGMAFLIISLYRVQNRSEPLVNCF